jgi:hypothetical protein
MDPMLLATQALALLSPYLARAGNAAAQKAGEAAAQHAEAIINAIRRQFGADHDTFGQQALDALVKQPDDESPKMALQGIVASKAAKNQTFKAELERILKDAKQDSKTQQWLVNVYGGQVGEIFQIHSVGTINVGERPQSD